jgi:F420 biosynthesis protein FbiB-like protein
MSSDLLRNVRERRSVRNFLHKEIPGDALRDILESAMWAPSAHNAQPWRFVVITGPDEKKRLAEAMANEWRKDLTSDGILPEDCERLIKYSIERFTHAPILIVASIVMEEMHRYRDERRQQVEHTMATQSLAAAIQNMLLAAHSKGLGSCWFCAPLFCQDAVRKVLGIPCNIEPQALITVGYPSEQPVPPPRKPLKEIVSKDRRGEHS